MTSAGAVPHRARVVVVGGGVMGVSIAFHLAEAGMTDVLLVERGEIGGGSSGKPIGGVRAQFSDPLNIELGARSLRAYRDFGRRPGCDIGLDLVGYLFLLRDRDHVPSFEAAVALQNAMGVPTRFVDPAEAARLCPYVHPDTLIGAVFSPGDGHARPPQVVAGYARAARALGVRIATGTQLVGVDVVGNRVVAARTDRGRVACDTVVCATGAWSAQVGDMVGVPLPVRPVRRQLAFTRPLDTPAPRIPFTIDFTSSAYLHNSDDGLLLGLADPAQAEGFDVSWTPDWLEPFRRAAATFAPALADLPVGRGWAGLYEVTPDHNALIGRAAAVDGFLYATGFSGHGFLQAPAVGEVVRDLVLGRTPVVDVAPLHADRFTSGVRPRPEGHVV